MIGELLAEHHLPVESEQPEPHPQSLPHDEYHRVRGLLPVLPDDLFLVAEQKLSYVLLQVLVNFEAPGPHIQNQQNIHD